MVTQKKEYYLTEEIIEQLLKEGKENQLEDKARSVIAAAEAQIRKSKQDIFPTANTEKLEGVIAKLGIALMEHNKLQVPLYISELEICLSEIKNSSNSPFGGFGDVFDTFFGTTNNKTTTRYRNPQAKAQAKSEPVINDQLSRLPITSTTNIILQSFLENLDPAIEQKRVGAWEALENNKADGCAQSCNSMRETLRLVLDKLASTEAVQKAPWYVKPKGAVPVTRFMRIRYALAGRSSSTSESTISLIDGLSSAVDAMYAKLSAESHGTKRPTATETRMYLTACESILGLIATQRHI
jgi:hypothetical protein